MVLSGVTSFALNEIAREDRDLLLQQKVAIIEQSDWNTRISSEAVTIVNQLENQVTDSSIITSRYINLQEINLKIFSLDLEFSQKMKNRHRIIDSDAGLKIWYFLRGFFR